jgi:hypothetical protein
MIRHFDGYLILKNIQLLNLNTGKVCIDTSFKQIEIKINSLSLKENELTII